MAGATLTEETPDAALFFNHQPNALELAEAEGVPLHRRVLIALEPFSTLPSMYQQRAIRRYGLRFAPSPIWARKLQAETFTWPQRIEIPPGSRRTVDCSKYLATIIAGDKRSSSRDSLYGLRREVIRSSNSSGVAIALAGPGWDRPMWSRLKQAARESLRWSAQARAWPDLRETFSCLGKPSVDYFGVVPAKSEFLRKAPIAIVIENTLDYVSEKLVDAVLAGVCPVYVGPALEPFGFPEEICVHAEPSPTGVLAAVRLAQRDPEVVIERGREWLRSEAAPHMGVEVMSALAARIVAQLSDPTSSEPKRSAGID
jgi:hypothetical protein